MAEANVVPGSVSGIKLINPMRVRVYLGRFCAVFMKEYSTVAFTSQHICRVRVGVAAKDDDDSQQSSRNSWHVPDDFVLEMFHNDMARRGLELISDESCDPLRMQEEVVKASQSIIPISR